VPLLHCRKDLTGKQPIDVRTLFVYTVSYIYTFSYRRGEGVTMVEIAVTKRRESVGANQTRGCEVRLDQVSKQYTQGNEKVAALHKVSLKDGRILDSAAR